MTIETIQIMMSCHVPRWIRPLPIWCRRPFELHSIFPRPRTSYQQVVEHVLMF